MSDTTPEPAAYLATSLRALRNEKHWSLDRAAQETGVSKAMLGQIERGESSPTIATLWKIASGFHVSLSSFLAPLPSATDSGLVRRNANALRHQPGPDAVPCGHMRHGLVQRGCGTNQTKSLCPVGVA